jgi:hypothetical protein
LRKKFTGGFVNNVLEKMIIFTDNIEHF